MTQEPKIGKCQHCHESGQELEVVEIDGVKKEICDACRDGYLEELETKIK